MSDQQHPEHPDDDALADYADGLGSPEERALVAAHLASCPTCAGTVRDLGLVRRVLRQLPLVDPPPGFYDRTLRLGPRPRSTASQRLGAAVTGAVVAVVAVMVVLGVVRQQPGEVDPVLGVMTADLSRASRNPAPEPGAGLPAELEGFRYQSTLPHEGKRYWVYESGSRRLALTWEEGEVDDASVQAMTPPPTRLALADGDAWYVDRGTKAMLVVERGERVYTVVLPLDVDPVTVAAALPEAAGSSPVLERLQAAGRSLLESFGFG